ncbi:MAG: glycosyltransferase [Acidobacteriaceae bacterium]|nr:glycosyltransferase [Acidobacteriaceae bacterium]
MSKLTGPWRGTFPGPIRGGGKATGEVGGYSEGTSMRIALLLTSLGMGGAERQVVSLAERLEARGHSVLLVTLMPRLAEEWATPLRVMRAGMTKSPLGIVAGLLRAHRMLRAFQPDILHSHTRHANLAARFLGLSGAAPRVVTTLHSVRDGGRLRMLAYRLTDALAARTVAVSDAVAAAYMAAHAVPASKCAVIPNAIDAELFRANAARRMETRARLEAGDAFVWLAAGRATPAKDYPNLLAAFAAVAEAEPRAELWIAGEGTETLPVASRVRRLGLRRDLPALLDAADGFVLSSAWEGMPLAMGEAMAMEKPVVATRVGGVEQLGGDCAMLAAPRDAVALADAMLATMRRSHEQRCKDGRRARARIVDRFGWEACVRAWERLYARVLEP